MNEHAQRVATVLFITSVGNLFYIGTAPTGHAMRAAIGCWVLALVYAVLTSPRRYL